MYKIFKLALSSIECKMQIIETSKVWFLFLIGCGIKQWSRSGQYTESVGNLNLLRVVLLLLYCKSYSFRDISMHNF